MKIVIDIPEKTNAHIRSDYGHGMKCLRDEDRDIVCDAIYAGEPYKQRPHGEWIVQRNKQGAHIYSVCSKCKVPYLETDFPNFCPNCGSDNRKRGDEK